MARIRPAWTPSLTGDSGDFTIGHRWSASAPVIVDGAWYYLPPAAASPPTLVTAKLYLEADESQLATGSLTVLADGWNLIEFAAPYPASASTGYRTAVQTNGEYGWDSGQLGSPITDPAPGVVTVPQDGGAFLFGHGYPDGTGDFMHGADTEFELDAGEDPNEGAAAFTIEFDLAAAAGRPGVGSAAFTLGLGLAAASTYPTPAERIFTVPAQRRVYTVPAEVRTFRAR